MITTKVLPVDVAEVESLPSEIENLLIPNPISSKQRFSNEVVKEVYDACVGKITSLTLLRYARSQWEERWKLQCRMDYLTEMREKLKSSKDGNWINVRKFNDKVVLSYKTISMAKKTVSFLDRHMRAHTMNGINFLESLCRRQNDVIGFLGDSKQR